MLKHEGYALMYDLVGDTPTSLLKKSALGSLHGSSDFLTGFPLEIKQRSRLSYVRDPVPLEFFSIKPKSSAGSR